MEWEDLYRLIKHQKRKEIIEYLENGGDPNLLDKNGSTLIEAACMYGQHEIIKILVDHGGDINLKDNHGVTALAVAAANGHHQSVELLLELGAEINVQPHGWSLMEYVENCDCPSKKVRDLLLTRGAV